MTALVLQLDLPDAILSSQFFSPASSPASPCLRLMAAVLQDCVQSLKLGVGVSTIHSQRIAYEARDWLSKDDWAWPFSFVNICAALGLDAEAVRQGIAHAASHPVSDRRGPYGEVLPVGVYWNVKNRSKRYRVSGWDGERATYHSFETLTAAQSFYEHQHQGRARRSINWAARPQRQVKRQEGYTCMFCRCPIVYGEWYRYSCNRIGAKIACEECVQRRTHEKN